MRAFLNLTGSTLLPSKTSATMLIPFPSAAVSSVPKPHALVWYTTLGLHANQLAALSPSNAGISNLLRDCTCCTAVVFAAVAGGGLLPVYCIC